MPAQLVPCALSPLGMGSSSPSPTPAPATAKVEISLQELKKRYTIVIVPHSVQQAARVADHAVFILQGELVEEGVGSQLFTTPRDQRTEDYVTGRFG